MHHRRVVVTGFGMITPAGLDARTNWRRMLEGSSAVDHLGAFGAGQPSARIGGEVDSSGLQQWLVKQKASKFIARSVRFAVAAAKQAIDDSRLLESDLDPWRSGVYLGSGGAPSEFYEFFRTLKVQRGASIEPGSLESHRYELPQPFFLLTSLPNAGIYYLSILCNAKGVNHNFVCSDTASTQAIGEAVEAIKRGDADVILAGGFDSLLNEWAYSGYTNAGLLSSAGDPKRAMRPFDSSRDGFVVGEGGAVVVVEELSHALSRGAPIHAEILGYASTFDAWSALEPHPRGDGLASAIKGVLRRTGVPEEAVGYISANGNATSKGDSSETLALKQVFGRKAYEIPISSVKPITGYLGAASGAVECIATVLAVKEGRLPPTINYETVDPVCDLDYVPNRARDKQVHHALSLNTGLGGQNTALLISRIDLDGTAQG